MSTVQAAGGRSQNGQNFGDVHIIHIFVSSIMNGLACQKIKLMLLQRTLANRSGSSYPPK